jgi:hypothetical protein
MVVSSREAEDRHMLMSLICSVLSSGALRMSERMPLMESQGELLAFDRHQGHVLHGFAYAFAPYHTAAGSRYNAGLGSQFMYLVHHFLEVVTHGRM